MVSGLYSLLPLDIKEEWETKKKKKGKSAEERKNSPEPIQSSRRITLQ